MRWQNKITKKELKHLSKLEIYTLTGMKLLAKHHKEARKQRRNTTVPCFICKSVERKLGLPI